MDKQKRVKRQEFFAFIVSYARPVIHFTRHFSQYAAEKHYGDLSRHYRGSSASDYHLSVYEGKEEFERELGGEYNIDYKAKTLTEKKR